MKKYQSALLISVLVLNILTNNCLSAQRNYHLTKQQWIEDLHFAVKILMNYHPNLYYRITQAEFQRNIAIAEEKIRHSNSDEESFTAIRQAFASIWDGHTRLGTNTLADYNNIFPVRFYDFSDGVFITGITGKYAKYIGSKVVNIGRFSAQEALKKAGTLAFADNEFGRKCQAPVLAITCNYAFGLGITQSPDSLVLEIETPNGKFETIRLSGERPSGQNTMISTMDIAPAGIPFKSAFTGTGKEQPLFIRHLDGNHNYWFEHDKENRMLYMQFNLVVDQPDGSFEQFYRNMFKYFDEHAARIDKFVVDVRFNGGGNGRMLLPFINEIIKRDNINRPGSLYVLTGRRSFSAAVLFIAEMINHTNVLLVGEPAGAAQSMFSDIELKGTLPNCGATLLLSTAYFNIAWPANKKYFIAPHFPVQFSSTDFFSGRDPALEAIKANKIRPLESVFYEEGPKAAMDHFHKINMDWGLHSDELSIMPYQSPVTKYNLGEGYLNNLGYELLSNNKVVDAQAAFELNTLLFPESFNVWDSLAECYMKQGDNQAAIKYYNKSLELNPGNANAKDKLIELKKKK
jgi:tetratricopeptide (TPR) repeat protein